MNLILIHLAIERITQITARDLKREDWQEVIKLLNYISDETGLTEVKKQIKGDTR